MAFPARMNWPAERPEPHMMAATRTMRADEDGNKGVAHALHHGGQNHRAYRHQNEIAPPRVAQEQISGRAHAKNKEKDKGLG